MKVVTYPRSLYYAWCQACGNQIALQEPRVQVNFDDSSATMRYHPTCWEEEKRGMTPSSTSSSTLTGSIAQLAASTMPSSVGPQERSDWSMTVETVYDDEKTLQTRLVRIACLRLTYAEAVAMSGIVLSEAK